MVAENPKHPESVERKRKRLIRKRERLLKDLRTVEEELRTLKDARGSICDIGQTELHADIFQEAYQKNLSIEDLAQWIAMESSIQEKLSYSQYQALSADHAKKQTAANGMPDSVQNHKERTAL